MATDPTQNNEPEPVDFDQLASAAFDTETGEPRGMDQMNALWAAVLDLDKWHFLIEQSTALPDPRPAIVEIDSQRWLLAFTDSERLRTFAVEQEIISADDDAVFLSMEPVKASAWLQQLGRQGGFGVRFNQGKFGWFSPVANLDLIRTHLEGEGLLSPKKG